MILWKSASLQSTVEYINLYTRIRTLYTHYIYYIYTHEDSVCLYTYWVYSIILNGYFEIYVWRDAPSGSKIDKNNWQMYLSS